MLRMQSTFHWPKQMKIRRHKIWTYNGCGTKVQPRLAVCSIVFKLVWGLSLLCWNRNVVFSGLTLEAWAFSLVSIVIQWSEFQKIQKKDRLFPIPKDSAHHFTCWGLHLELFLRWGIHNLSLTELLFQLCLVVVTICLIPDNDTTQETISFIQFNRSWQTCIWCSFCFCSWDTPGTNFAVFQCFYYSIQFTEANIQLHTQFPSQYLMIRMNKLTEMFLIFSWWRNDSGSPPLVQIFTSTVCRLLFITGKNAELMVVIMLKNSLL